MSGRIGFYVHHHGRGHANRARQIIEHLTEPVTVFGSSVDFLQDIASERVRIVALPSDVVSAPTPPPDVLHYAPVGVKGICERMYSIATWIHEENPKLLVVDVSVEVTLFARLMGLPTVVMRQNGIRDDLPHQAAYQSCEGLLAPYSALLEEPETAGWVREKTYYAGGFSRYSHRTLSGTDARQQLGMQGHQRYALVMSGLGGSGNPLGAIAHAAQACPHWEWWVVGPAVADEETLPPNVRLVGQVEDTLPYLKGADVVVASAGNNTVMEIATAGVPYICIPEERPFGEQVSKAEGLRRLGAAIVLGSWPEAGRWPTLLKEATKMNTVALAQTIDTAGAARCAHYISQIAREVSAL